MVCEDTSKHENLIGILERTSNIDEICKQNENGTIVMNAITFLAMGPNHDVGKMGKMGKGK